MSWNEPFEQHHFTDRQRQVMDYMHIRYECNDDRDTFAKSRKAGANIGGMPFGMNNNDMVALDDDCWIALGAHDTRRKYHAHFWIDGQSSWRVWCCRSACTIYCILWQKGPHNFRVVSLLADRKQEIIQSQTDQAVANNVINKATGAAVEKYVDVVKVIDMSYLEKGFKVKE